MNSYKKMFIFFLAFIASTKAFGITLKDLEELINRGDVDKIKELISEGKLDVNDNKYRNKITPLHLAVLPSYNNILQAVADVERNAGREGNAEIVKIFIDAGADVNAPDKFGETPLRQAIRRGAKWTAKILISAGAGTPLQRLGYSCRNFFSMISPSLR